MAALWKDRERVTPANRRRSRRAKINPNKIVYMNFPSDNGGIVLDISSVGLGFQTANPLEGTGLLSFQLSPSAIQHFEISGQVVWLDKTRKRGGLQLTHLPVEVQREFQLSQLQMSRADVEQAAGIETVPQNPNSTLSRPASETAPRAGGVPSLSVQERAPRVTTRVERASDAAATSFAAASGLPSTISRASNPLYSSEGKFSAPSGPEQSRGSRHAAAVPLIVALLLVVGLLYLGGRRPVGELLIGLGESISGKQSKVPMQAPAAARDDTATMPALPAGPPDLSGSAVQNSKASGGQPQTSTADEPRGASGGHTRTSTGAKASEEQASRVQQHTENISDSTQGHRDNGQSELAQARRYVHGTGQADAAIATQLLWAAVGKGNSQAEVELADLYLRGERGAAKNCKQARILLVAAEKNHNPEAGEWLARLRDHGCR